MGLAMFVGLRYERVRDPYLLKAPSRSQYKFDSRAMMNSESISRHINRSENIYVDRFINCALITPYNPG